MAIAVAPLTAGKFDVGNKKVRMMNVTFTGSYVTGGETIAASAVGMKRIMNVLGLVTEAAGETTAWAPHWAPGTTNENGKVKLFGLAAGATGLTEHGAIAYAAVSVGHLVFIGE